jgi:serine phosphatase RsbU (regulator of sigma subunit)
MRNFLFNLALRIYPALDRLSEGERSATAGYVIRGLVFLPPSLVGLAWLVSITDLAVLRQHWLFMVALFGFVVVLSRLWLEVHYVTTSGGYRSERRSFWGEALWSGVLVFGPAVNWLGVALPVLNYLVQCWWVKPPQRVRLLSQSIFRLSILLPGLVEISVYQGLGGIFPLPGLALDDVLPAVVATLAGFSLGSLMIWLSMAITRFMSPISEASHSDRFLRPRLRMLMTAIGPLAGLVAILPAGLYSLAGAGAYFGFLVLMVAAALMADQLSRTLESVRQRTRELEQLEQLSQAILHMEPGDPALLPVLSGCVSRMFPHSSVAIYIQPEQLLIHPAGWDGPHPGCWSWQCDPSRSHIFLPGQLRPWPEDVRRSGTLVVPIVDARNSEPVGRIYLRRDQRGRAIDNLLPAVQSLAGHVASALYNARIYQETLSERIAHARVTQELALAGQIQASFLPASVPEFAGCQIATCLEPAYETSGDFYDIIPMWDGRLGLVIADVADKGIGAALYMALSRTLMRAYAIDYSTRYSENYAFHPERVINTVNQRIVEDTQSDFFVTLFYAIYDPRISSLNYANAAHNPPYLCSAQGGVKIRRLTRTGLPVGIFDDRNWERGSIAISPGDVLVMYTDGVTEAENGEREQFGDERLEQVIRANLDASAQQLCDTVRNAVNEFAGSERHSDDITLMVVRWEKPQID